MKAAAAIRKFFNNGPCIDSLITYPPVSVTEIRDFKLAMEPEEWQELARQACDLMGETLEV